jgi:hypothetical protein
MAKPTPTKDAVQEVVEQVTGAPVLESAATPTPVVRERKKRTPVGGARDILTVPLKDPNYEYRWVVDSPGRIQRFKDGGWEVDTDNVDIGQRTVDRESRIGSAVTKASGDGRTLVLMRIPKEWYDEDQKAKSDRLDALDGTMRQDAKEGRYGVLEVGRKPL